MNIRHATPKDIQEMTRIEGESYPAAEGASEESIRQRVEAFPNRFWLLENDGEILSFINGLVTDYADLTDDMYDDPSIHQENGQWQMIFSVVTAPKHRHKGYASYVMHKVIEDCRQDGRCRGIVLTCKEKLIPFYAQFGFVNEGISVSTHGDTIWYQMRLTF